MNWALALTIAVSVGVPIATLFVNAKMNAKNLAATKEITAASKSKVDAEALDLNFGTMNKLSDRLQAQVERDATRLDRLEAQNDQLERQNNRLERMVEEFTKEKEAAYEQSDLLAKQLEEERVSNRLLLDENRLLATSLATAQGRLTTALAQLDTANHQIKIMVEHATRLDAWYEQHKNDHHPAQFVDPPPKLILIDPPEEPDG